MQKGRPRETALAIADSKGCAPRTAQQTYLQDHLHRVHNEIESTTRKLQLEKRRLNKLDEDLVRTRTEYEEKVLRQTQPKVAPATQKETSTKKLEHRLAKAISQLNELCHENSDIRAKIDMKRREKLQMNRVFNKLQSDIKENSQHMSQLQHDTELAQREHEDREQRISNLKKQLEIERKTFKASVQKMQKDMKEHEREELTQRVRLGKSGQKQDEDKKNRNKNLKADEEDEFNSPAVMRKILKLSFLNSIQRRHIKQHQKNIEVFEQAFATIRSTTGISEIEEIVKIFIALEQRNFSLLTYVNQLNTEIEFVEKRNRELEEQLSSQKKLEIESASKRTSVLTDLAAQIESTARGLEENQAQTLLHIESAEKCKPMIQSILRAVEKENRGFGGQPAPEFTGENMLAWLTYIEKTLTQWKDFIPEAKDVKHKQSNKDYKYTVGNQVLALQPKKHSHVPVSLVKPGELPSAVNAFVEQGAQQRGVLAGREEDSSDEEDDLQSHPWTRAELREKARASVAKRKKHKKMEQPTGQLVSAQAGGGEQGRSEADPSSAAGAAAGAESGGAEMGYDDLVEKHKENDDESLKTDDSDMDDDVGPTDEEINEIFLKRYKMSREELQGMADKMGIQLNNLCYLKQEFDAYDADRSGYMDVKELKGLLEKLGEDLNEEELDQAFRELDSDNSGEIEFFEFVEWFTSED